MFHYLFSFVYKFSINFVLEVLKLLKYLLRDQVPQIANSITKCIKFHAVDISFGNRPRN